MAITGNHCRDGVRELLGRHILGLPFLSTHLTYLCTEAVNYEGNRWFALHVAMECRTVGDDGASKCVDASQHFDTSLLCRSNRGGQVSVIWQAR